VINALLVAVSEEQLRSNLRGDLPLAILGSIIAAIGVAALVVHLSRWRSSERVLLWFGLFAGPYWIPVLRALGLSHAPISRVNPSNKSLLVSDSEQ
jgi:hypothetical protein